MPGVLAKSIGVVAWVNLPYVPDLAPQACSSIPSSAALDGYLVTPRTSTRRL